MYSRYTYAHRYICTYADTFCDPPLYNEATNLTECMHGFCVSAKSRSYFLAAAATSYGFNYGIACRNVRHLITGSDIL